MLNISNSKDGTTQLAETLNHWYKLYSNPNNSDGAWFTALHKEFRQVDVIDQFYTIRYVEGCKEYRSISGYLDGLFHSIISNDRMNILYELLQETFRRYDTLKNTKITEGRDLRDIGKRELDGSTD
jgi:hypothetical protein